MVPEEVITSAAMLYQPGGPTASRFGSRSDKMPLPALVIGNNVDQTGILSLSLPTITASGRLNHGPRWKHVTRMARRLVPPAPGH
ncbi:hypothetical protein Plim_2685 [Planctopirus limnophila DSM 3776]|uniref:Uncharacterized protein n=1 Tax=Planctopirus limnophila (strain ATCC 43296 / DSM 3776 / IFAM 1008 / Mu 290) TaxID=521674 RepID=D5SQP6_PLAL2|nr:hypothetical protein Plim_2685 [Planctopirus limnophila DSM 3776]